MGDAHNYAFKILILAPGMKVLTGLRGSSLRFVVLATQPGDQGNNWQVGPQSMKQSQVRGKWYLVRRTDEISAVRREISSPRVTYKRFLRATQ